MMQKIKIVTDSASDIPQEDLDALGIEMLSIPIAVDGKSYFERESFSVEGFYDILDGAVEIPVTSRIPQRDYFACYRSAMEKGYTHLINVTINAGASGVNASAQMARKQFYADIPGARKKLEIHIVDSETYSLAYGWPVMQAAKMARNGRRTEEILLWLEDYFSTVEIYLGCYTLEYAKKSGRINAAAAFVGDVLGLRPIISMIGGGTKIIDKVRGEKNISPRILQAYLEHRTDPEAPVLVVCGKDKQYGQELAQAIQKQTGLPLPPVYPAGACIVTNAGPRMLAVICRGKKRKRAVSV